jgi:hypothetical protein
MLPKSISDKIQLQQDHNKDGKFNSGSKIPRKKRELKKPKI